MHVVRVAGLVEQLRARARASQPPDVGRHPGGFGPSSPRTAHLDLLARVEREAVELLSARGVRVRGGGLESVLGQVTALVGSTPDCPGRRRCPGCDMEDLARRVRGWWAGAMVATGWHDPPREVRAPCPACDAPGIMARAHPVAAWCPGCGAGWDEWTIGVLADHARHVNRKGQDGART